MVLKPEADLIAVLKSDARTSIETDDAGIEFIACMCPRRCKQVLYCEIQKMAHNLGMTLVCAPDEYSLVCLIERTKALGNS